MTRPRSKKRAERDALMQQALQEIARKQWQNPNQAAKALEIPPQTID